MIHVLFYHVHFTQRPTHFVYVDYCPYGVLLLRPFCSPMALPGCVSLGPALLLLDCCSSQCPDLFVHYGPRSRGTVGIDWEGIWRLAQ